MGRYVTLDADVKDTPAQAPDYPEDGLYSLACEYLGWLQITYGLDAVDLEQPGIMATCSGRLGALSMHAIPVKMHTGYTMNNFPFTDNRPLSWPGGAAKELNLGPWHKTREGARRPYSAAASRVYARSEAESAGSEFAPMVEAYDLCTDMLDGAGYGRNNIQLVMKAPEGEDWEQRPWWERADWDATFETRSDVPVSQKGVNREALKPLDTTLWRVRLDGPPVGLELRQDVGRVLLPESSKVGCWRIEPGLSVRLGWNPKKLIDGCLLDEARSRRPNTIRQFASVPEALLWMALEYKCSEERLLETVLQGDNNAHPATFGDPLGLFDDQEHSLDVERDLRDAIERTISVYRRPANQS